MQTHYSQSVRQPASKSAKFPARTVGSLLEVFMLYAHQALIGTSHMTPMTFSASVFPRHSACIFKEALAVISLALVAVAVAMLGTVFVLEVFGDSPEIAACTILDQTILLRPWCSALI